MKLTLTQLVEAARALGAMPEAIRPLEERYLEAQAAALETVQVVTGDAVPEVSFTLTTGHVVVEQTAAASTEQKEVLAGLDAMNAAHWLALRQQVGLVEDHRNALYLVLELTNLLDQPNVNGDVITRAEAVKALATLNGQPMDVSVELDQHQRERYTGINGIRGYIYGARIQDRSILIGVVIWARDFPEIAESILNFREVLGASWDVAAGSADYTHIDGVSTRILKDITFQGGTIIAKQLAADKTTSVTEIRYRGMTIEELEQQEEMTAEEIAAKAAAILKDEQAAAATVRRIGELEASAADAKTALETAQVAHETALAAVNAAKVEVETALAASLKDVEAKDLEIANRDEKLKQTEEALAQANAKLAEIEKAEADRVEAQAAEALKTERMGEIEKLEKAHEVKLFASDELRAEAAAQVAAMSEADWKIALLQHENVALKTGKGVIDAQASERTSLLGSFGALGGNPELGAKEPVTVGERIAAARRKANG